MLERVDAKISSSELVLLKSLYLQPLNINEIAAKLRRPRKEIEKEVYAIFYKGYIKQTADHRDRIGKNIKFYKLTDEGERILETHFET